MNFGIHSSSFSFVVRQGPHSRHTRTRTCIRAYFARHAVRARRSRRARCVPVTLASAAWAVAVLSLAAFASVVPAAPVAPAVRPRPCPPSLLRHRQSARARARRRCIRNACRPAPASVAPPAFTAATDPFAIICSVKSNVSRQSGERKSSNARQFSSIISACKRLRQARNSVLKHPAPFVLLPKNNPCEQPL